MKREYVAPIVEKVTFDYKIQTDASQCFGSVINQTQGISECDDGTPFYFGWNNPNPGGI